MKKVLLFTIIAVITLTSCTFAEGQAEHDSEIVKVVDSFTTALNNVDIVKAKTLMPDLAWYTNEAIAEDMSQYNKGEIVNVEYPTEDWYGYMDAFITRLVEGEEVRIKYILYKDEADNIVVINYMFDDNTTPYEEEPVEEDYSTPQFTEVILIQ